MQKLLTIFIIVEFFSCSNQVNRKDELIINEIFNELTVKMYLHNDVSLNLFPPPPPIDYENDSLKRVDSISYQESIKKYLKIIEDQKLDGNKTVLAIGDSLISYNEAYSDYVKQNLPSKNYFSAFESLKSSTFKSKQIDLKSISKTGNFELRYLSTFYPLKDFWEIEREYKLSGFLQFSRIYLDEKAQHGIFYCSYSCGRLCGHGDYIFIKKFNGEWIIEKTIQVWIS